VTAALAVVLAAVFGVLGIAKLAAVPAMRTAAHHVGLSVDQYRLIGALEVAGALGVLAGLLVAPLGLAAAIGLGLLMVGAVVAHAVHRDGASRLAIPVVVAVVVVLYAVSLV
jgi:hypothetical protein